MTAKDFFVMLWLALASGLLIQYFWGPKAPVTRPTEQFSTKVDFIETRPAHFKSEKTEILTDTMQLIFSSEGASLERLAFKRPVAQGYEFIDTIFPPTVENKKQRSLLVTFNEYTPYYYTLIDKNESEEAIRLTYQSSFNTGTITKTFTIHKHIYQIDLALSITNATDGKIQPRIWLAAPTLASHKDEGLSGIVTSDSNAPLRMIKKGEELINSYWTRPTVFGAQDIYFIHALVADKDDSVKRGYFSIDNESALLMTVLECESLVNNQTYNFSFYCGPKEEKALVAVNPRLVQTIDYGWFAPIGHLMLKVLNYLYQYTHNYGWAIIVLTFLIRLFLLPFNMRAERSMKQGAELSRKLQALERKYKDDPETLDKERKAAMIKHGVGLGGCLGLLIQIPVLVALSYVLRNSIELYRAPFIGSIHDLSVPDPYYILPLLLGLSTLMNIGSARDTQQRIISYVGALAFGAFSTTFPAGLTLYVFVSTALGVIQSMIQRRLSGSK